MNTEMTGSMTFACPCGNKELFTFMTTGEKTIRQNPETGERVNESDFVPADCPNGDTIICEKCGNTMEYEEAEKNWEKQTE